MTPSFQWEILSSFFAYNRLNPIFHDCNFTWGWQDEEEGLWNGAVEMVDSLIVCFSFNNCLQVSNNKADFGVPFFSFSHSRSTVVTFSAPTDYGSAYWYSKAPGTLPPGTNLIRIFTWDVWLLIFVSMVLFSIFLLFAAKIGTYYGIITESYEDFLVPFR